MKELQRFLAMHPDINAVQIFITDPSGVPRGKSVRASELEAIYRDGRRVAGSILGLDITGEDVDATGLVWEAGDADGICRPVPGTLLPSPWLTPPTGQLFNSFTPKLDSKTALNASRKPLTVSALNSRITWSIAERGAFPWRINSSNRAKACPAACCTALSDWARIAK